jgi:hypothetical protein
MTGLEFVQGLATGALPLNMIARTLGYDVTEAERGRVVVAVEPSEVHLNPYGTVHGGRSQSSSRFHSSDQLRQMRDASRRGHCVECWAPRRHG